MKKTLLQKCILFVFILCIFSLGTVGAWAAPADDSGFPKGVIAACGTQLSEPSSVDTEWPLEQPKYSSVKVGLSTGDAAETEVFFSLENGDAFSFGYYDTERVFHEIFSANCDAVGISSAKNFFSSWRVQTSYGETVNPYESAHPAYINGVLSSVSGYFSSAPDAENYLKRRSVSGNPYFCGDDALVVFDAYTYDVLFIFDSGETLAICAQSNSKAVTEYNGRTYYGGFELPVQGGYYLSVINVVEMEDYVKGVIPYEMSSWWPLEALKAQALCARTYAAANFDLHAENGFDLTDNTECQVYRGTEEADEMTDRAVDLTAGQYIRYEGKICEVYYFSSDGGSTEDGKNIFGTDVPYLAGKTDPFEAASGQVMDDWYVWLSCDEISWMLAAEGHDFGYIVGISAIYTENGNVSGMNYVNSAGVCNTLYGRDAYECLGLYSAKFTVEEDYYSFVFTGSGWGHNCGMSQWGAYAMASIYGYDCEDIIKFYFTGVSIG